MFSPEATDPEIIAYAEEHDWVILTGDKRFLIDDEDEASSGDRLNAVCGVIFYAQDQNPASGNVVGALETIAETPTISVRSTYAP